MNSELANLTAIFVDEESGPIIQKEKVPRGQLVLDKEKDAAYINILMKVDEISIGSNEYKVESRQFFLDGLGLVLTLKKKKKKDMYTKFKPEFTGWEPDL